MSSFRKRIILFGLVIAIGSITYYSYFSHCVGQKVQKQVVTTKTIFSFLGAPGCGKGTLAEQCVNKLDFKMVSTGNLCREEIARRSDKGKMIAEYTRTARLVPDAVIAEMLENWLNKQTGDHPIILDGFPRTRAQAKMLADLLKDKFSGYRFRVISLEVDDLEKIVQRMAGRLVCENRKCQATTHISLLKDPNRLICEKCGGKLIRRDDDKEEIVRKRIVDFTKNNDKIIAFYKELGIPVETLNVSDSTPAKTFEAFRRLGN